MNTLEIRGDWDVTQIKLRQKWAKLTDADLQFDDGEQDELLDRIQGRTGETREVVENAIKESSAVDASTKRSVQTRSQNMKPEPQEPDKNFGKDMKAFDRLPAKTKELIILKDDAEKATGREGVAVQQKIRAKSK